MGGPRGGGRCQATAALTAPGLGHVSVARMHGASIFHCQSRPRSELIRVFALPRGQAAGRRVVTGSASRVLGWAPSRRLTSGLGRWR